MALIAALVVIAAALPAAAGSREQARRIHDRLVGVPPSEAVLTLMAGHIDAGNPELAAQEAMRHPLFYSSTIKNLVTPWTNEAQNVFAPLNDYSATVIGLVRDDRPFDEVLSADVVYVGAPGVVETAYSHTDNEHYEELEDSRADLSDPAVLVPVQQSSLPGSQLGAGDAAGVLTTRAAGEAFFQAGTNRRMFRFTSMNYLCRDLEELKDTTRPTDRIRQDVSRAPGGDSSIFLNQCSGCHSGMDPLAGAFAYYEWDAELERVVYTRGEVQNKYLINDNTFPLGFATADDSWVNYWRNGANAAIGWQGSGSSGNGAKSLGEELSETRAFSVCKVEQVFEAVCLRPPTSQADRDAIESIADGFETSGKNLKDVFAGAAVHCMGD
ncbi:MAG: hypothetical protein QNK05_17305 [Myxococcota bacterium]|nr:hypothetical protein [Myxococcota bacterium]